MEYNEELALRLIEIHGLNANAFKVWRTRGSIPKKYFNEDGVVIENKLPDSIDLKESLHLRNFLTMESINSSNLNSISLGRSQDFLRGKGVINKKEYNDLKREMADLKNRHSIISTATYTTSKQKALLDFFKDKRVKPYVICKGKKNQVSSMIRGLKTDDKYDLDDMILEVKLFFQSIVL